MMSAASLSQRSTLLWILLSVTAGQNFSVTRLRVEYLAAPLGVDVTFPRFSWALEHSTRGQVGSSYRIVVSSVRSSTIVWDSGTVLSNRSVNIPYSGTPLAPDSDFSWSVVCGDNSGTLSPAAVSNFSTGLYGSNAWHGAEFISSRSSGSLNTYRSEFSLERTITRARLYVTGLGYAKTWLNGVLTDDHQLGHFTTFEMRTLYDVVDVSSLLQSGCNSLGIMLGRGWFSQPSVNVGPRQFRLVLSVTFDDSPMPVYFVSKNTAGVSGALVFAAASGPVLADDIYIGETYSGLVAAAQSGWSVCGFSPQPLWQETEAPSVSPDTLGAVSSAQTVPIRIDRTYSTLALTEPLPNVYVFGR
jgi:alpha-L-rhamnosidase